MASLFGITSAKYQYAIDEYYKMKKEVSTAKGILLSKRFIEVEQLSCLLASMLVRGRRRRRRKTDCRKRPNVPLTRRLLRKETSRSPEQSFPLHRLM